MNERHRLFCLEYIKDFNASRAYRAVYEKSSPLTDAKGSAHRLMQRDDVKQFIAAQKNEIRDKKIAEADEVLAYFTSVMRGEIEMSDRERNKAAEVLAKRYGITEDRAVSGGVCVTIIDDV